VIKVTLCRDVVFSFMVGSYQDQSNDIYTVLTLEKIQPSNVVLRIILQTLHSHLMCGMSIGSLLSS
jgi:hypothetical protein